MTTNNYAASTSRSLYHAASSNETARLWSIEKLVHDLAAAGWCTFFEGAGTNPTGLTGYASSKLWLRVSAGVTTTSGEIRGYDGSGDATSLASWPLLDIAGLRRHLQVYSRTETGTVIDAAIAALVSPTSVTTRTALKAVNTATGFALLLEPGREGLFQWDSDVSILRHQADTGEYDLVPPSAGSVGAWVRLGKYGQTDIKSAFLAAASGRAGGKVVLQKKRSSGAVYEHHVYAQMGLGSAEWVRWVFSNHTNASGVGTGSLRNTSATRCALYASTVQVPPPALTTLGGHNDDVTGFGKSYLWGTSTGTETGAFTSSTIGNHTIRYSTTIADQVVYTIQGVSLISIRGYATTNGGIARIIVKDAGVEIASGYLMPATAGERLISFLATGSDVGLVLLPIATVDPQKTYTVEVIVHATNPVGGRMYQAGLAGWPFGWLTTPGSYGAPIATTTTARRNRLSGERTVYKCANCTQIKWQTRRGTDRGIAGFEIYNSAGISVTPDLATYDCYNGSNDFVTSTIASDLAEADYYLHVITSSSKNASSTGYAIDHVNVTAINQLRAGNPDVDSFDLLGALPLASSTVGTQEYMGFDATNELVRAYSKTSEGIGASADIGGVHGGETLGTPVFKVDGAVVDFAGGAVDQKWVGESTEVTFSTTLLFPSDSSTAGSAAYTFRVTPLGYDCTVTDTLSANVTMYHIYGWMLTYPSDYSGTSGLAGGFDNVLLQPRGKFTYGVTQETTLPVAPTAVAVWNDDYALASWPINFESIEAVFAAISGSDDGNRTAFISNNALAGSPLPRNKFYRQPFAKATGITVPSGTAWTVKTFFGVAKTRDFGRMIEA